MAIPAPDSFHAAKLARDTRQRLVEEAGQLLRGLGAAVRERLTGLMQEVPAPRNLKIVREVWAVYQSHEAAWLQGTLKQWKIALQPPLSARTMGASASFELLGTDVVENRIIASRLALNLLEKASAEVQDLHLRIKFLEHRDELEGDDILQPETLLLAIVAQWDQAGLPRDAWPMINEVVQNLMSERLQLAYASCNAHLIAQGVLPTIEQKLQYKRTAHSAPRRPEASEPAAPASRRSGFGAAGPVQAPPHSMSAATPLARARSRALGVMGQLKRLMSGATGADFDETGTRPPSPALAAALAVRPRPAPAGPGMDSAFEEVDPSPAGVSRAAGELRHQTVELKNKAETHSEKALIEIVALMFQAILQEDRIPPGIRVWFARLQMPVLRLALAEPSFFGTLSHPARQLIDRMGSCVMGFDASGISGGALEMEIQRLVGMIEQYPETGKRVYQLALEEFQSFLEKFLTGSAATQKLVGVAQQVEQKETLTIQYTIEMRNMLKDMPVRDEIRDFLFKVWAEVLAVAAVRKGPQHAETLGLKQSATDLVWAASAKPNRSDRARVIQKLPQLVQGLRAGMTLLGVAPAQQEAHIKIVSETLADAFLSKTHVIPSEKIQALAERLTNLEDFVSEDGMGDLPLDAQSIEMILGLEGSLIEVVADVGAKPNAAMQAWAKELELGAWFTLDHNARVAQVQFVWRSERKHLHLFASTDGRSYLVQAGRLAAYLQAGLLVPEEEETLTERATRDALGKLEANPERLLS